MRSQLRFLTLLLLGLGLGFARPAMASHAQGGTLTYTSLGGNSYRVRVDFFRDCSGIPAPATVVLTCKTTCNGTAVTATLNSVGQPVIGTPYSSSIQPLAVCPIGGSAPQNAPTNFAAHRYEGTVTLTPNQWVLSVEENARPNVANIVAPGTLRLESTLDNRTRTNTSATFSNLPTIFVPHLRQNLLHIGAYDADGDSLSYSLVRPMNGCNSYDTYAPHPTGGCQSGIISTTPPCLLACPFGAGATYSARLPISVSMDTLGTCPSRTASPRFAFDSLSGAFAFIPNRLINTPSVGGDNKYAVVVRVTEWRKVGAAYVRMGTVRRDMFWIVFDGINAAMPRLAPTVSVQNGTQTSTQALGTAVAVRVGEPITVNFTATSPGATTPLVFTLEQNAVPGAVIAAGPTPGTGRLTFTPPVGMRDGVYNVSLTVSDDASPLRNLITVPVAFRVYSGVLARRTAAALLVPAYPNPFTEQVQFQLAKAGVQTLVVCDQLGRTVARLTSQANGRVQWQPGADVPAGLYLARTQDGRQTVRLLRIGAL